MKSIKIRLSALMFMQFFVYGATVPVISLILKTHFHFNDSQAGIILAFSSISAFISPLITTFVADRMISAERLLAVCNFTGSVLMLILSLIKPDSYSIHLIFIVFLFF